MRTVTVDEPYQSGYIYTPTEPVGKNFHEDFKPELIPKQMFQLGVFGGDYFQQIPSEFPADWFYATELSATGKAEARLNYFKVNTSQPLQEWERKGWIYFEDQKGWLLWYCRYYMGRRIPEKDLRQIRRWKNMCCHITQVQNHCKAGDAKCRPRQRQALLHWAYDSRKL